MEKNTKVEAIDREMREKLMDDVKTREGGVSVKDVMSKYGRTEQTYYFWKRQARPSQEAAPKSAKKRAVRVPARNKGAMAIKSGTGTPGVLMPEGRPVRIHTTGTEWAIVTFE